MAYGVSNKIPANSILRQGTLIVGVPRQEQQPGPQSDPMLSGMNALEVSLQRQLAEANGGKVPSPQQASIARAPKEST